MSMHLASGIHRAYEIRQDLLVIALVGRTGSGCTTAASILSKDFGDINIVPAEGAREPETERRKISIVREFAAKNWVPFKIISASTVIFSFLLTENTWAEIEAFLSGMKVKQTSISALRDVYSGLETDLDKKAFDEVLSHAKVTEGQRAAAHFFEHRIQPAAIEVRKILAESYVRVFQGFGNNLRLSGNPLKSDIDVSKVFSLVERIAKLIEVFAAAGKPSHTRVVIDAIRNPLELVYLRDYFSQFLAFAITADETHRQSRLARSGLTVKEIERLDNQEYPRDRKHLDNYECFVSQNLEACIQKSDVFISNSGLADSLTQGMVRLGTQLVSYTCLALKPGLITPTRDERCMQLAFVAKLNSGCISRQVGAAVADLRYSVKAVGWNDVPSGQIPCLLRDADALLSSSDNQAFSEYEKNNQDFRKLVDEKYSARKGLKEKDGLRCPFCFKQMYNALHNDKNQVHTRSLHAEENAFLQLTRHGSTGIDAGSLYTTASPCELCSKKAFQLGIKEIIYVDPYPGISSSHILASGNPEKRPKLILFSGAVGQAYHRLYEPIVNIKDEVLARLTPDKDLVQPKLV